MNNPKAFIASLIEKQRELDEEINQMSAERNEYRRQAEVLTDKIAFMRKQHLANYDKIEKTKEIYQSELR